MFINLFKDIFAIEQDLPDGFLDPGARGYSSFHGVVSSAVLQLPLWSLRRPHFSSGLRTPPLVDLQKARRVRNVR